MKDFDIAKFLRENQLGSYGILNHYVDIKPIKEEEEVKEDVTPEETAEIPYEGPEPKLDGFGDEFEQEEPVSEEWHPDQTFDAEETIASAITKLTNAGISIKQIKQFVDKQLVASADSAVFENK